MNSYKRAFSAAQQKLNHALTVVSNHLFLVQARIAEQQQARQAATRAQGRKPRTTTKVDGLSVALWLLIVAAQQRGEVPPLLMSDKPETLNGQPYTEAQHRHCRTKLLEAGLITRSCALTKRWGEVHYSYSYSISDSLLQELEPVIIFETSPVSSLAERKAALDLHRKEQARHHQVVAGNLSVEEEDEQALEDLLTYAVASLSLE